MLEDRFGELTVLSDVLDLYTRRLAPKPIARSAGRLRRRRPRPKLGVWLMVVSVRRARSS